MSCIRCGTDHAEPRQKHGDKTLCDRCADRLPVVDSEHPCDPPDPRLLKPPRLQKQDGRISHHERRYGGRRHEFANLLARAELEPPYRVEPIAVDGHLTVIAATIASRRF